MSLFSPISGSIWKPVSRGIGHTLHMPVYVSPTWYEIGSPVVAYQLIGAASYADAKTNLANPGTYNATDIVAPSWSSVDGLTFTGSESLDTNMIPSTDGTWSMFVRFSDYPGGTLCVAGALASPARFDATPTSGIMYLSNGSTGSYYGITKTYTGGVFGFAGKKVYDGGIFAGNIPAGTGVNTATLLVGGWHSAGRAFKGKIQCLGVWDFELTPAQVTDITTKMAAL